MTNQRPVFAHPGLEVAAPHMEAIDVCLGGAPEDGGARVGVTQTSEKFEKSNEYQHFLKALA